jgi:putative membrane protein insertion efficiency factor
VDLFRRTLVSVITAPIRLYQLLISPALGPRCKYEPSCSAYAVSALRRFGVFRGAILAVWRILRCNPFSHGGYDPVEAQTLFRRAPRSDEEPETGCPEREHDHQGALV